MILSTTSIDDDTSNPRLAIKVDNEKGQENKENKEDEKGFEIDNDLIEEVGNNGVKIILISKLNLIPTELEDGGYDGEALDIKR
ncbi:hypothetical protein J1N35_011549 [Gossypium stocksii]|uniref:Uncharacterized protein n=1 Tax=Gossypium stocksii TaxID=47602 RepID=A0A9D3W2Q3_9ROSI|nr:hypothetical protein J1N35_011549 [Gossypium stocksii]